MLKWLDNLRWWWRERTTHRLGKTDEEWDAEITALSYVFKFEKTQSLYVAKLGPTYVWVSSFPFACFQKPREPTISGVLTTHNKYILPSLRTQYMLRDKLKRELGKEFDYDYEETN